MCVYQVPGPRREKRKLRLHAVKGVATAASIVQSAVGYAPMPTVPTRNAHLCMPPAAERSQADDGAPFWRADLVAACTRPHTCSSRAHSPRSSRGAALC